MGLRGRQRLIAIASIAATLTASPFCAAADPDPDPWFGRDKLLHFGVSAAIAAGGYGLGKATIGGYAGPAILGSSLSLAAGATKELIDLAGYGDPSWRDLTWDVVGAAVGTGLCLGIDAIVHAGSPPSTSAPPVTVSATPGAKGLVVSLPLAF
jgi:putative lipoprotein